MVNDSFKLLIDLGNSSLKWAIKDTSEVGASGKFTHQQLTDTNLLINAFSGITVEQLWVASVASSQVTERLLDWAKINLTQNSYQVRSSKECCGVINAYSEPEKLGVDRWLGCIAAWHTRHKPVCVVDCGTAVTLDVVDRMGLHCGGYILAGINAGCQLVQDNTTLNIEAGVAAPAEALAKNTEAAIVSGYPAAVAALTEKIMTLHGCGHLVLTGSDVNSLLPFLDAPPVVIKDLVLDGLFIVSGREEL